MDFENPRTCPAFQRTRVTHTGVLATECKHPILDHESTWRVNPQQSGTNSSDWISGPANDSQVRLTRIDS